MAIEKKNYDLSEAQTMAAFNPQPTPGWLRVQCMQTAHKTFLSFRITHPLLRKHNLGAVSVFSVPVYGLEVGVFA